ISTSELATSYAALILANEDVEITAEKLQFLITSAKFNVDTTKDSILTWAIEGEDVKDVLLSNNSG
ncbi:ribosomal protein P1, partial [Clathrospora elynae]